MEKYIKLLSSVSHFNNLKPSDLLRIINSGHLKRYRKGTFIYQQGDPSAPVIMFNELAAIDGEPNPATALAVKDCLTWNIDYESFEHLVKQYPDPTVGLAMMRLLASRTRNLITLCGDLSFRSVLSRCVKLILELSNDGTKPIDRSEFPLSDLAARVATAPESISRSLSWLDKRGLISCDRNKISVQNAAALLDIVIGES